MHAGQSWAIVLAAGAGARLSRVTSDELGRVVPKQFCSLRGGRSLLRDALARAASVAPVERILVVVAAEHRPYFELELADLPRDNLIVQPRNRGTAAGILLPLLALLERDSDARVAVLPSDHYVRHERVLTTVLERAVRGLDDGARALTLLGITPDSAETGYGWIVAERAAVRLRRVRAFVEKPAPDVARALFDAGGLWNSFLFAVRGAALAELYAERLPGLFAEFRSAFAAPLERRAPLLRATYAQIGALDFCRDLLEVARERLRVIDVPSCGWTDLGTPRRLADCLRQLPEPDLQSGPARVLDLRQRVAVLAL